MNYAQWRNSYIFFLFIKYHFNSCIGVSLGARGSVVVEALCYILEGRGIAS
jgi:hypothetical protein